MAAVANEKCAAQGAFFTLVVPAASGLDAKEATASAFMRCKRAIKRCKRLEKVAHRFFLVRMMTVAWNPSPARAGPKAAT